MFRVVTANSCHKCSKMEEVEEELNSPENRNCSEDQQIETEGCKLHKAGADWVTSMKKDLGKYTQGRPGRRRKWKTVKSTEKPGKQPRSDKQKKRRNMCRKRVRIMKKSLESRSLEFSKKAFSDYFGVLEDEQNKEPSPRKNFTKGKKQHSKSKFEYTENEKESTIKKKCGFTKRSKQTNAEQDKVANPMSQKHCSEKELLKKRLHRILNTFKSKRKPKGCQKIVYGKDQVRMKFSLFLTYF